MENKNESIDKTTNEKQSLNNINKQSKFKYQDITSILIIFAVCFICTTFIFNIILKPLKITGSSMQPTINEDYTYFNEKYDSVYYKSAKNYQHGDIVIIQNNNEKLIKRVVAMSGDKVCIRKIAGTEEYTSHGELYSVEVKITVTGNNNSTQELLNYAEEKTYFYYINSDNEYTLSNYSNYQTIDSTLKNNDFYAFIIPENHIYCLGDNRNVSTDSRHYGAFNISQIQGEVVLHIPYGKSILYAIWNKIFR